MADPVRIATASNDRSPKTLTFSDNRQEIHQPG
jgi:hypothetical protein